MKAIKSVCLLFLVTALTACDGSNEFSGQEKALSEVPAETIAQLEQEAEQVIAEIQAEANSCSCDDSSSDDDAADDDKNKSKEENELSVSSTNEDVACEQVCVDDSDSIN